MDYKSLLKWPSRVFNTLKWASVAFIVGASADYHVNKAQAQTKKPQTNLTSIVQTPQPITRNLEDLIESTQEHQTTVQPSQKELPRKEIFSGESQYFPIIERACAKYNVPVNLLKGLIATESSYDPKAVSPQGAKGLCQLMPAVIEDYGITDPFDPEQNVFGGARHLGHMLKTFKDPGTKEEITKFSLGAYHDGLRGIDRIQDGIEDGRLTIKGKNLSHKLWKDVSLFVGPEAKNYVPRVLKFAKQYSRN